MNKIECKILGKIIKINNKNFSKWAICDCPSYSCTSNIVIKQQSNNYAKNKYNK